MASHANNAIQFLVDTVLALYIIVVLLRILLQLTRANFHNPVSHFVRQLTQPVVQPLNRVIPRWQRLDVAAVIFALVLCFINIQIDLYLYPTHVIVQPGLLIGWTVLKLLVLLCNLYFFTILIEALFSWISPGKHTPATAVLWTINEPLLRPVRRYIPDIGGLDISPLVVIIVLQVISRLLPLPGLFR